MTEELVTLCTESGAVVGSFAKATVHTQNTPLHKAFSCFLFTRNGELLLQQRALTKKTWPGAWSNSVCGHPLPGEETVSAVHRRLLYELGISSVDFLVCALPSFLYWVEREGVVEHELCPVFVGLYEGALLPNSAEVFSTTNVAWGEYVRVANKLPYTIHPRSAQEFISYRALFNSVKDYELAHTVSGLRVSEWSLWETKLLSENESFKDWQRKHLV